MKDFAYPIKDFQRHRLHDPDSPLISPDELFGLQKCDVIPPTNLYHPVLPVCDKETGKLIFPFYPLTVTWTHIQLQKDVEKGSQITLMY